MSVAHSMSIQESTVAYCTCPSGMIVVSRMDDWISRAANVYIQDTLCREFDVVDVVILAT